jgi:A/G-specific adenine glycosylase
MVRDQETFIARETELRAILRVMGADERSIPAFRSLVLEYYRNHGRRFPWRETTDPYRILIAEVMLQQTPVERVRVKYGEFLGKFPNVAVLATAPLCEILKTWHGMGYNRRAIALQEAAQSIVLDHGGNFPCSIEVLVTLPGVGRATAGAILAYAYNAPVAFIEVNVRRVFIHFFFQDRDRVTDREILPLVAKALVPGDARTWYNALMDYGAFLRKRSVPAARRGASYHPRPRFTGSNRELRGRVLSSLISHGRVDYGDLPGMVSGEEEDVYRVLGELVKEGFIMKEGHEIRLVDHPVG